MPKKTIQPKYSIGQRVFVKSGRKDADFPELPIGGWSGQIIEVAPSNNSYLIKLDARTLRAINPVYKKRCERDGFEFETYWLGEADLQPLAGDPIPIEQPARIDITPLDETDQDDRVRAALGLTSDDPLPAVEDETLAQYHAYLTAHLRLPCEVAGIEDFGWEEPYVLGGWDPKEYKKLKKTRPSYSDRYQLLGIEQEGCSEWMMCGGEDIVAHVQRTSDGKKFALGLSELKATDKMSPSYQLLDDYAYFFWNHR